MKITAKEEDNKGIATAMIDDEKAGFMSYSIAGDSTLIIDHTEVLPSFKGQGVGKQLLLYIVNMARKQNKEIIPLCPFANAMFQKMDDIQEVLKSK